MNNIFPFPRKTEDECPVGTPFTYFMKKKLKCIRLELAKIAFKFMKYKLTSPLENPPEFPTETNNLVEALAAPVLNQPSSLVVASSLINGFKDYNPKKLLQLTWPFLWFGNAQRNKVFPLQYLSPGSTPNLNTSDEYAALMDEYRKKQKGKLFGIFPVTNFIKYPLVEEPCFFDDITYSNKWERDDVFTMQRLAGLNPTSLRIQKSYLEDDNLFNPDFKWDRAVKDVSYYGFNEMVDAGKLFVLDYPLLEGFNNTEDIEANEPLQRPMRKTVSPISLFVSVQGKSENTLKPVAIQMDRKRDAAVFTPKNGSKWLMAKEEVQRADYIHVEMIEHLLKTHLLMEPICVIMRRTFSKLHPLYQLFEPHCKYLSVTNSIGLPTLFDEKEYTHILFSIGNTGSIKLVNKGYKEMSWEDTNFKENLKKRGVLNVNGSLPYFPYRDDGLLLWDKLGEFARDYVKLYYPYFPVLNVTANIVVSNMKLLSGPASVITDVELQSFALQLRSKNIGRIAGGRFKDFPPMITTREQLIDVVRRILFIPIHHSAINYPIAYYGAFTPNMPTKLYDPETQDFTIDNLPRYNIAVYQLSIAMSLGSIRYTKIFDYSENLVDPMAKELVEKYYREFHKNINDEIANRNKVRGHDGKFMYPYFMPEWLTNSIET